MLDGQQLLIKMLTPTLMRRRMSTKLESKEMEPPGKTETDSTPMITVTTLETLNHNPVERNRLSITKTAESSPFNFWDFNANKMKPEAAPIEIADEHKSCGPRQTQVSLSDNQLTPNHPQLLDSKSDGQGVYSLADIPTIKPLKPKKSKLIALKKIHALLVKFFLNHKIEVEDFNLRTLELHILAEILIRKNRASSLNK